MFITVTRFGGSSTLRLAAAAVAHITAVGDGASVHLVSGEHVRVDETPDEVERLVCQVLVPVVSACETLTIEPAATRQDLDELLAQRFAELALALRVPAPTPAPIVEPQEARSIDTSEPSRVTAASDTAAQRVEHAPRRGRGRRA